LRCTALRLEIQMQMKGSRRLEAGEGNQPDQCMIAGGQTDIIREIFRRKLLMKKLIGLFVFVVVCAGPVKAQDYARFDISGGPSFRVFQQTFTPDEARIGMVGWYLAADYNFHKFRNHFAAEFESSGNYRNQIVLGTTSVYTIALGPKFYPLGHHRLTPFGHVLFGGGYYRDAIPAEGGFSPYVQSYGSFAWEGGGGLDLNVRKHWGVRMIEFDYAQTRFPIQGVHNNENNYRIAFGINYRFGKK
jgi:hypothetical protein